MEYTVHKLSRLAGVSARTLRYYHQLGLLKPARINSSGYRIYGQAEVDLLQQILFFRELGFPLRQIRDIVTAPDFDRVRALREHRGQLLKKRAQLEDLIANVEKTIAHSEGRMKMSDREKFHGFKQKLIEENEEQYGEEARARYGDAAVDKSRQKLMSMTEEEYAKLTRLEREVKETLSAAFKSGNPAGELAQKAADLHRRWLGYYWPQYSKEAHAGLAQTYVDDPRFTAYYDSEQPGTAAFLRDAIHIYTGQKKN